MQIIINGIGIQDSGGITVLEKVLDELRNEKFSFFYVVCSNNTNIVKLLEKYKNINNFEFSIVEHRGFLYRLYYENIIFRKIIIENNINLIYNFSGSAQFFLKIPQLVKVHNLLFYSKKLDLVYKQKGKISIWLKQIFLKRIVFKFMLSQAKYIEIQSIHVKNYLSDFIKVENKIFFVKSDIEVFDESFQEPKKYNFTKKIKFLYIVGPHFEYIHKNFVDFRNIMIELDRQNLDFEINITLTKEQLDDSSLWNHTLDKRTNYLGYISNKNIMQELFSNNAILISTSIIETLGLHVIEGIKNGIITIVPNEKYSKSVYGKNIIRYRLFDNDSLYDSISTVIYSNFDSENYISSLQSDLKESEKSKNKTILNIFDEVLKTNVQ